MIAVLTYRNAPLYFSKAIYNQRIRFYSSVKLLTNFTVKVNAFDDLMLRKGRWSLKHPLFKFLYGDDVWRTFEWKIFKLS